jgi:hypothetical protein
MIDWCLGSVADCCSAYIDDILISTNVRPGETREQLLDHHYRDVQRVLNVLKEHKLIADLRKCKFFIEEVEFCGHILGHGQRRPAPGKLTAVEKFEPPKNVTSLRSFLGLTNYYSEYIENYSQIISPLLEKLKVNRKDGKKGSKKPITWTEEDQKSFDLIKKRLVERMSLLHVDPDKPFILRTDASGYAVGAVLEQLKKKSGAMPTAQDALEGRTQPVAFMSRKLTEGQRKWVPREQETYAILLALMKWETWIRLQPVLALTNHKTIESWQRKLLDVPRGPVGRRGRWHEYLSKYDINVEYIPGKDNAVADCLSRWAYPASEAQRDTSMHGSARDEEEMEENIRQEREVGKNCFQASQTSEVTIAAVTLFLKNPPSNRTRGCAEKVSGLWRSKETSHQIFKWRICAILIGMSRQG